MSTLPASAAPSAHFPRGPLIAIGVMLCGVVLSVAAVRWSGVTIRAPDAPPVQTRALRFEDRPDGRIAVIDAMNGREVHAIVGESGFVRGTLRGLARERKRSGGGPEQAFELSARADGRLTLHDPVTGRIIDLDAFGPVNAAGFAALLNAGRSGAAAGPVATDSSLPTAHASAAAPTRTP